MLLLVIVVSVKIFFRTFEIYVNLNLNYKYIPIITQFLRVLHRYKFKHCVTIDVALMLVLLCQNSAVVGLKCCYRVDMLLLLLYSRSKKVIMLFVNNAYYSVLKLI